MNQPQAGQIWQHEKHDPSGPENNFTYEIVGISIDVAGDTPVPMVHYKPLYDAPYLRKHEADFFSRALDNFLGVKEKDGQLVPRFVQIKK